MAMPPAYPGNYLGSGAVKGRYTEVRDVEAVGLKLLNEFLVKRKKELGNASQKDNPRPAADGEP